MGVSTTSVLEFVHCDHRFRPQGTLFLAEQLNDVFGFLMHGGVRCARRTAEGVISARAPVAVAEVPDHAQGGPKLGGCIEVVVRLRSSAGVRRGGAHSTWSQLPSCTIV